MKYVLLIVTFLGLTACGKSEEKTAVDKTKDNPLLKITNQAGNKAKKAVKQQQDSLPQ